ncbi:DUF1349 domain-containing protein [bacterium]|nr:DUF1349 domain-containing protein [bacterium]
MKIWTFKKSRNWKLLQFAIVAGAVVSSLSADDAPKLEGRGRAINPAGDCTFDVGDNSIRISVPGSDKSHDLSPELGSNTAPRVVRTVTGNFAIQVKVSGDFKPGGESTQAGRTGYTGAGLVLFADEKNFVRLERAVLQRPGDVPRPYINFEIRVNGRIGRMGTTGDFRLKPDGPVWLSLERKGLELRGAVSADGKTWSRGASKSLDPKISKQNGLSVGVAAISTSRQTFNPEYSELRLEQLPNDEPGQSEREEPD